jgi:hypothetical protein
LHCLIDGDLKMRDAARHLVERGKHGDRILNLVGPSLAARDRRDRSDQAEQESGARAAQSGVRLLHHAPHL